MEFQACAAHFDFPCLPFFFFFCTNWTTLLLHYFATEQLNNWTTGQLEINKEDRVVFAVFRVSQDASAMYCFSRQQILVLYQKGSRCSKAKEWLRVEWQW
jgi:hypothetical protein